MSRSKRRAAGFTLVELLVVILIIAILVGLLIPAVWSVMTRTRVALHAFDIARLDQAIEQYKNKYSDYPPDFTDVLYRPWNQTVVYRHVRKAFPRCTTAELNNLQIFLAAHPITPPEALVFWLGGMSDNALAPFTGQGGPLIPTGNAQEPFTWRIQYRNEPIFEFTEERLVLEQDANGNIFGAAFLPKNSGTPFVYFDSRTYAFVDVNGDPQYAKFSWTVPDNPGAVTWALPYKSDILNTAHPQNQNPPQNAPPNSEYHILRDSVLLFANRDKFQIVGAGPDGFYGPESSPQAPLSFNDQNGNLVPLFTRFSSGLGFHPQAYPYGSTNPPAATYQYFNNQADNLGNFSEGTTIGAGR